LKKLAMKKPAKKFWKIELNYAQSTYLFYRWAIEKDFALTLGTMALAQKLNRHWRAVDSYIRDGFDRYKITEMKDDQS